MALLGSLCDFLNLCIKPVNKKVVLETIKLITIWTGLIIQIIFANIKKMISAFDLYNVLSDIISGQFCAQIPFANLVYLQIKSHT